MDKFEFELGLLGDDKDVEIKVEDEQFSIKDLINLIIEFINKLIKFEF